MNCNACEAHIAFYDETSVAPIITGNTMRNGDYAVTTKDTQLVTVPSNTISILKSQQFMLTVEMPILLETQLPILKVVSE